MSEKVVIGQIRIQFLASFGGKDNWEMKVPVQLGDTLKEIFERLPKSLYEEIREKVLLPEYPRFGVMMNGKILPKENLFQIPIRGEEKIALFARLVGG